MDDQKRLYQQPYSIRIPFELYRGNEALKEYLVEKDHRRQKYESKRLKSKRSKRML